MKSRKLVVVALVMGVAACSELVAPGRSAPNAANVFGGVTTGLSATDTTRFSISIDPWRSTTYYLGAGNSVTFPAGSICDPNTSTFGLTEWNRPCDAARYPVRVNVRAWLDATGHARVDFTPNLRFVPSVLPAGWVNISFGDVAGSRDGWHNILYCGTATRSCVDESAADPSLLTKWDPVTGKTARRIKHLSGYLAASGSDSGFTPNSANRIGAGAPAVTLQPRTASLYWNQRQAYPVDRPAMTLRR